jgi:predicted ATPase/class 3 adenylate cyclase/Tfp pilus assembly protein PilF
MTAPPRALLLTDVVDSTRLSHALGDEAMARVWIEHDRAARDLLRAWRGREIEKTDGLLALFETVADAVGFATGYHRALAALAVPLRARVGFHAGAMTLRETSTADADLGAKRVEVDGLVKPITARVMAIALGGQTLLTGEARAALGATALRVLPHGHWRLKGVPEPLELFEIGEADAPFTPPPDDEKAWRVVRQRDLWLPVREVRHSLPAERDSFVGRSEPLQVLARKLEEGARLVSVLGMGGTGKTRFATRFALSRLGDFPGGIWFCDLSAARSVDGILFAVAQGLDLPIGKSDPAEQLTQAIAGRGRCLVILDNFEQVARHAEETLGHWLDGAPQAQFIVTTREVLGIVGEETMALAPLNRDDGVALFLRRAEAARSGYSPDEADLRAVTELVRVLDGLPLAIELAAARVRVMAPHALLERMNRRFDVLMSRSGRRDRQATLRAAFDWSWELLSDPEKSALAQLSVFEGGFTLAAAEAVVRLDAGPHAPSTVDVLQWLVDKSFVREVADERFDLLESVREYAAEHLRTEGRYPGSGAAAADAACRNHWRHFAGLDDRAAMASRCIEANNLVVACRRSANAGDVHSAVGCLQGVWAALRLTGPLRLCSQLADMVAELPGQTSGERARVHWVVGNSLNEMGRVDDARRHIGMGLALATDARDGVTRARLLFLLGMRQTTDGQLDDAERSLIEAHDLADALCERTLQAYVLNGLGRLMDHQSRLVDARAHYDKALALARDAGDRRLEGGVLGNLGGLHHDLGRLGEARRHYECALALARDVGDRRWEGNARCNLGLLYLDELRPDAAAREFDAALLIARETGHMRLIYTVICNIGLCLMAQGQDAEAALRVREAIDAAVLSGDLRSEGQFSGYLAVALARLGRMAEARAALLKGERILHDISDALSLALLLCNRAEVESLDSKPDQARAALDRAARLARELNAGPDSELGRRLAKVDVIV